MTWITRYRASGERGGAERLVPVVRERADRLSDIGCGQRRAQQLGRKRHGLGAGLDCLGILRPVLEAPGYAPAAAAGRSGALRMGLARGVRGGVAGPHAVV